MALGFLFGQALCLAYVILQLKASITKSGSKISPLLFIRRHWRFPAFSLPADSLSSFGALLPVALISSNYGAEAAGQVALTIRVLAAPVVCLAKPFRMYLNASGFGARRTRFVQVYYRFAGVAPIIVAFVLT